MAATTVEIQFAQKLAANEKKTRDKALKKLRKYVHSRSSTQAGFSEADLVKLWKGLHYCMWMQDKPLLQEELAVHISRLLFSFSTSQAGFLFFKVFLLTESREWNGIDRLRIDKFMMLIRQMLNQMFVLLKQDSWTDEGIQNLSAIVNATLLNTETDNVPDSLAMHFADIFIPELTKVGWKQLSSQKIVTFLKTFDSFLQVGKRPLVFKQILSSVYDTIIKHTVEKVHQEVRQKEEEREGGKKEGGGKEKEEEDSDSGYDEDSEAKLKFDAELIADHLFEIGSSERCCSTKRHKIYNIVKRLRDANCGVTESVIDDREEYDPDDDFDDAVERLNQLNTVKRKKKKHDDDTSLQSASETTEAEEKTNVKKKRRKRKLTEESQEHVQEKSEKKKVKLTVEQEVGNKPDVDLNTQESVSSKKRRKRRKKKSKANKVTEITKTNDFGENVKGGSDEREESVKNTASEGGPVNEECVEISDGNLTKKKSKKHKAQEKLLDHDSSSLKKMKPEPKCDEVSKQLFKGSKNQSTPEASDQRKSEIKSDNDMLLEEGEVEIWVPNRKYQNKLKKKDKKKKEKTKGAIENKASNTEAFIGKKKNTKETKPKSAFAQFQKLSSPPAAFVRKAAAKVAKTPSMKDTSPRLSTPQLTSSEKKVKFNMKKNTAQKFEDSITVSPLPAFLPSKSPVQGILKSPVTPTSVMTKPSKKKKKQKTKLTPSLGKKAVTRSRASDFF